ncbi:hypothetical protein HHK36_024009 [Tetracentron sinense]|uniref:Uncharacterized protein n=1 Tax=Tetracentron sinense TaxID=13715 RepID=A0A834YP47_TETSI|nr:hypothetical protein HHK36_024009 [Tetracentron sinense]
MRNVQRSAKEQLEIVDCIYKLKKMWSKGELKERTYSEPQKWMSGKGRVTIQFGCCYNFATDKNGNPLGILCNELVDPIPPLFKKLIKRLLRKRGGTFNGAEKERRNVQRRIQGKIVNILDGLELHISFLSAKEQLEIFDCIYKLKKMWIKGELKERTYSEPQKWMSGKGRVTIQFGCCYNFATDKNGNPLGILRKIVNILDGLELHISFLCAKEQLEIVDCIFKLQKMGIKGELKERTYSEPQMWMSGRGRVTLQFGCCYNFATDKNGNPLGILLSFLSECNILFGSTLKDVGPGEFSGATVIPLSVGFVLVLNGNGANIAKYFVPTVPFKRISITFRKMDEGKQPVEFVPESDLQGLQPLPC